jgi:hypothetical protein
LHSWRRVRRKTRHDGPTTGGNDMTEQSAEAPATVTDLRRNPFGVADVPAPGDDDVISFAAGTGLAGGDDDVNAVAWSGAASHLDGISDNDIDGQWASRWNGGQDPTIAGDSREAWKTGPAEGRTTSDTVYLLFSWDEGRRRGLIEARRRGTRLVGKYVNLCDPSVTRPWVGLIVSERRIDGRWPGGRLDFRR